VKGWRRKVLKSSNKTRENQDKRRKGEESIGLAYSERSYGHIEIFGTYQLLSVVY